jgi:ribosome-binding factor A
MPVSRRIARLNDQLRADLAELIARELKDPRVSGLVSITAVDLSPDLRNATVHVSVLGSEVDRRHTMRALRSASGFLRSQIAARLTTKRAPELRFSLDTSIERGERIMSLIREIEQEDRASSSDSNAADKDSDEDATGQPSA